MSILIMELEFKVNVKGLERMKEIIAQIDTLMQELNEIELTWEPVQEDATDLESSASLEQQNENLNSIEGSSDESKTGDSL